MQVYVTHIVAEAVVVRPSEYFANCGKVNHLGEFALPRINAIALDKMSDNLIATWPLAITNINKQCALRTGKRLYRRWRHFSSDFRLPKHPILQLR